MKQLDQTRPVVPTAESERGSRTRVDPRFWFAICALTLIVASDYKLRTRDPSQTINSNVDALILLEVALYGCVGIYLLLVHGRAPRINRTQPHLYFACCLVGLMALSIGYTPYRAYGAVRVAEMGVLLGLTLVAARKATRADLHRFADAYIVLIAGSVLYGVAVPSAPIAKNQVGRFAWLAIHPTVTGALTGIATVLIVCYLMAGRRWRPGPFWPRPGYWVALIIVGGGLLATQTRGAIVGALVGSIILFLALRGNRARLELQVFFVVVALGIGLAASDRVVRYAERGESTARLATLSSRTDFWKTVADAVEKKPMFGYGVTSARGVFYEETGLGGGHNAVVNVLVELGLVGFLVWGAFVLTLIGGVRRLPGRRLPELEIDRALILAVIAFLLIDGIVYEGPGSVSNVACTWLFVCAAWLAVARRYAAEQSVAWLHPALDHQD